MRNPAPRTAAHRGHTPTTIELTVSDSLGQQLHPVARSPLRATNLTPAVDSPANGHTVTDRPAQPNGPHWNVGTDDVQPKDEPLPYTILWADVVGCGALDNCQQLHMRAALHAVFNQALQQSAIDRDAIDLQDLGDAVRLIVGAQISPKLLLDPFIPNLDNALRRHQANTCTDSSTRLRLRLAAHMGLLHRDPMGWAGVSLVHCARLLDGEPVRQTLIHAGDANLAVIVSHTIYEEIICQGYGFDRDAYRQVRVTAKETSTVAWVHVPGYRTPPGLGANAA